MRFNGGLDDGEPEARAAYPRGFTDAVIAIEYARQFILGNTLALVGDLNQNIVIIALYTE
jgi:hypothetical protein